MELMCGTCGQEVSARTVDAADRKHKDGAHEPSWYQDGDIDKPVR